MIYKGDNVSINYDFDGKEKCWKCGESINTEINIYIINKRFKK